MRYFDINDNELQEEELDFELGYCEDDKLFIQHHDADPGTPREFHYAVSKVYFEDGTTYTPESEDDPHLFTEGPRVGRFEWVPQDGEEPKEVRGMDLYEVEDNPGTEPKEAWDTPEEKAAHDETERIKREKEELLVTGLQRLQSLEQYQIDSDRDIKNAHVGIGQTQELIYNINSDVQNNITEQNALVEDLTLALADIIGVEE